ncbi:MAG: GNAT family N-acetyltransferase [Candidatus Eisenbacteria bacterium]|nr:GNAT family N-acetyltransferase [Candidatus Eisenbacteria bacterium]
MPLTKLNAEELAQWADREAYPPYGYYRDFMDAACRCYRARQLTALAGRSDHAGFHWQGGGESAAFGLTTLGWDTEQFGVPAGRLDYLIVAPTGDELPAVDPRDTGANRRLFRVAGEAAVAMTDHARARGIRHLSARVDSRELPVLQALESAGFQLVDAILRFSLDSSEWTGAPSLPAGVRLRDAIESDIEPLAALAANGFLYDRFHNDPLLLEGVADRVHAAWLTNAIHGKAGDGVLVAEVDGRPAGFFILALDRLAGELLGTTIGTLVLITIDGTLRRRGVALALSLGSIDWLKERGATRFEVGTQLANVPAANVYLKAGFKLVQTSVSLRRMTS